MSFLSDLITAPFSAAGWVLGELTGSNKANATSTAMTREQMAWQSQEAEKNRQWQEAQTEKANNFTVDMWNRTNEYNSPTNQMQLLRAAGVNPAALLSGSSSSAAFGSASAPSAATPGSGSMPAGVGVPNYKNADALGGLVNVGSFMKSLAESKKLGVDTKRVETLLGEEVKAYILENTNKQLSNDLKATENWIQNKVKDTRVKQIFRDYAKSGVEMLNTAADTDFKEWQSIGQQLENRFKELRNDLSVQEYAQGEIVLRNLQRKFDSEFATAQSERVKNYATARDLNASAEGKELLNKISSATNVQDIENAIVNSAAAALKSSSNYEDAYQSLERAIKVSSAYKNSSGGAWTKVQAALEHIVKTLGIKTSVNVSK